MSRRAVTIGLLAAAALVLAGAAVALARGVPPDGAATGVENTRSPEEISNYWTKERMDAATPG
ncbi:hypothetical protein [Nonomuraea lactucae]|uniref:hypothetical protein n=1 Tax=Nonomuraea lactucae TaxID=2249762 RepID=UPI000DE41869|nr:hypothetical protein [Nonomuraea lactucae]